jgi:hypothetical protein
MLSQAFIEPCAQEIRSWLYGTVQPESASGGSRAGGIGSSAAAVPRRKSKTGTDSGVALNRVIAIFSVTIADHQKFAVGTFRRRQKSQEKTHGRGNRSAALPTDGVGRRRLDKPPTWKTMKDAWGCPCGSRLNSRFQFFLKGIVMTKITFATIAFTVFAFPALAGTVHLSGSKADRFIARHFPNAVIPGDVSGKFTYRVCGHKHVGRAHCHVPAMGERSNGVVSTCTVTY